MLSHRFIQHISTHYKILCALLLTIVCGLCMNTTLHCIQQCPLSPDGITNLQLNGDTESARILVDSWRKNYSGCHALYASPYKAAQYLMYMDYFFLIFYAALIWYWTRYLVLDTPLWYVRLIRLTVYGSWATAILDVLENTSTLLFLQEVMKDILILNVLSGLKWGIALITCMLLLGLSFFRILYRKKVSVRA